MTISSGIVKQPDVIPTSYLIYLFDVLLEYDIDISPYLNSLPVSQAELKSRDFKLLKKSYYQLLADIIQTVDIPALGVKVGQKFSREDYDILGYAFLSFQTLQQAMDTYFRYQSIVGTDAMCSETLTIKNNNAMITVECPENLIMHQRYEVELAFGQWLTVACMVEEIGISLTFSSIKVSFDKPSYGATYNEVFQCPIYYKQAKNQLVFSRALLEQPLSLANDAVAELCVKQYEKIIQEIKQHGGLLEEIKQVIIKRWGESLTPEEIAESLNIGYRTLRRRLSEEGTSVKKIYTEMRMDMAIDHLQNSKLSIQEIAFLLGYADVTTFHRAFKKCFQQTPGDYRESFLSNKE